MSAETPLLGGVELGGTKCVCIIGTGPHDIRMKVALPTRNPDRTLAQIEAQMRDGIALHGPIAALGVASFGPLDLARESPSYGTITTTAKPGWCNTPVAARLQRALRIRVGIDTDVNGAALAEGRWGAARGLADYAYVTVGTGIGVGLVIGGSTRFGFTHSELGHIRVARVPGDPFPGVCSYHCDCLEGLASGPAVASRADLPAGEIPAADPAWGFVAHALAQLLHTLVLTTAPRRILIGGGVVENRPELLAEIRARLLDSLNGYRDLEAFVGTLDSYAVPPGLGSLAGPLGALSLAAQAL